MPVAGVLGEPQYDEADDVPALAGDPSWAKAADGAAGMAIEDDIVKSDESWVW